MIEALLHQLSELLDQQFEALRQADMERLIELESKKSELITQWPQGADTSLVEQHLTSLLERQRLLEQECVLVRQAIGEELSNLKQHRVAVKAYIDTSHN